MGKTQRLRLFKMISSLAGIEHSHWLLPWDHTMPRYFVSANEETSHVSAYRCSIQSFSPSDTSMRNIVSRYAHLDSLATPSLKPSRKPLAYNPPTSQPVLCGNLERLSNSLVPASGLRMRVDRWWRTVICSAPIFRRAFCYHPIVIQILFGRATGPLSFREASSFF